MKDEENTKRKLLQPSALSPGELNDKVYQITPVTYNPSLYILSSLQQNSNKNTLFYYKENTIFLFFLTRRAKAPRQRCLNTAIRSFHFSILALGDAQFPLDPSHSLINKYIAFRGHLQIIQRGATDKWRYEGKHSDTGEQHCLSTRRHC